MPREIKFWTGVPAGWSSFPYAAQLKKPFQGIGLSIPLASGARAVVGLPTEAKVSFARLFGADFLISVGVYWSPSLDVDPLPRLSMTPSAGNSLTVRIGNGTHAGRELVVVPVTRPSPAESAGSESHSDQLHEAAMRVSTDDATKERNFEVDYGGISSVHLAVGSSAEDELILRVDTEDKQATEHPESFQSLHMSIVLHGANSISLCFREGTASYASAWKKQPPAEPHRSEPDASSS